MGNISACAERSSCSALASRRSREHLRVCGAVFMLGTMSFSESGTSPRVRSGLEDLSRIDQAGGNISACAERSRPRAAARSRSREHLRVCGAVTFGIYERATDAGTSPRVRSGRTVGLALTQIVGNISACAERSSSSTWITRPEREHLRVCGAVYLVDLWRILCWGTSPRVRSGPRVPAAFFRWIGNISACAERSALQCPRTTCPWEHLRVCGAVTLRPCYS